MEEYIFKESEYEKLLKFFHNALNNLDLSKVADRKKKEDILEVLKPLTAILTCQYDVEAQVFAVMLSPMQMKKLVDCLITFLPEGDTIE